MTTRRTPDTRKSSMEALHHEPMGDMATGLPARLRKLRLEPPPPGLRDRCGLPEHLRSVIAASDSTCAQMTAPGALDGAHHGIVQSRRRKIMRNRILMGGAGGLAAAAVVALVILSILPRSTGLPSASARMLQDARDAIDRIDAVDVQTSWDDGEGTPTRSGWKGCIVRGLGAR